VKLPNDSFVDCDGIQSDWIRNFRRKDFYSHPKIKLGILPYNNNVRTTDIVIDNNASEELSKLFKSEQSTTLSANHTLHEGLFY